MRYGQKQILRGAKFIAHPKVRKIGATERPSSSAMRSQIICRTARRVSMSMVFCSERVNVNVSILKGSTWT